MRLNIEMMALALLLAACGGHAGYNASYEPAPRINMPPVEDQRGAPIMRGVESPRAVVPVSAVGQSAPPPADLPQGAGPRATSGEERYDEVGYAGSFEGGSVSSPYAAATIVVAHPSLPIGSYVEVTALDSGHTIVALVTDRASDGEFVDLSRAAADLLQISEGAPVRIRLVSPSAPDQNALRSGRAASSRIDAPEGLLKALRRRLPSRAQAVAPLHRPRTAATPPGVSYRQPDNQPDESASAPVERGAHFIVQVGAFSTRERAQTAARQVGGRISAAGGLFRVQTGPYADAAAAKRGRDEAARHGYGDARIYHIE